MPNLLRLILSKSSDDNRSGLVTYLNPYSYLIARKNYQIYSKFDAIHSDGIALSLLLSLLGSKQTRQSFDMTSMAPAVFTGAANNRLKVVLIGGQNGVAELTGEKLKASYPGMNILGCYDGFFDDQDHRESIVREIVQLNPDLLVVGMGAPLQEAFLVDVAAAGWGGNGYTCGGFFHQTAKTKAVQYYPKWIDRLNLRWLYRMYDEPKLIKRYAFYYPYFLFVFLVDTISLFKVDAKKK